MGLGSKSSFASEFHLPTREPCRTAACLLAREGALPARGFCPDTVWRGDTQGARGTPLAPTHSSPRPEPRCSAPHCGLSQHPPCPALWNVQTSPCREAPDTGCVVGLAPSPSLWKRMLR